jgi:hypothetical protein
MRSWARSRAASPSSSSAPLDATARFSGSAQSLRQLKETIDEFWINWGLAFLVATVTPLPATRMCFDAYRLEEPMVNVNRVGLTVGPDEENDRVLLRGEGNYRPHRAMKVNRTQLLHSLAPKPVVCRRAAAVLEVVVLSPEGVFDRATEGANVLIGVRSRSYETAQEAGGVSSTSSPRLI